MWDDTFLLLLIKCTLGVFPALAFVADFPPAAPRFHQRTHRVRLRNLGTTDKKSSHKIKHKKIPRVHIFPILWSLWSKIFVFIYIIFLYSFIEFLPSNCSLYFRSRQRERSLNNILFYIEHLLEKWKKNAKAYDKNCHRQELGNAMIETAWKENIK